MRMRQSPAVAASRRYTMDFTRAPEEKLIQQTVRDFVRRELLPLEGDVLRNEREGRPGLAPGHLRELRAKARDLGFWGINTRSEEHTSELQSPVHLVCRLLLEKK